MNEFLNILDSVAHKTYVGFGYVITPPDVNRIDYIQTCFASETISIFPETGGMSYNDVPISREALQDIEFPDEGGLLGSQVVYVLHPTHRIPVIVGILSKRDESMNLGWKEFKLSKTLGHNEVTISGDAKQGNLFITVRSDNNSGGNVRINLLKGDRTGQFQVEVQGNIVFVCDELTLRSKTYRILANEKITLGVGNYEPAVLGQTLLDNILDPLINTLKTLTVSTALGPSGVPLPDTISSLEQIQGQLGTILSEKVELE